MSVIQKVQQVLDDRCPDTAKVFRTNYSGGDNIVDMNHYFRQVLSNAPVSTLDERGCLIDDLEEDIWVGYFTDHVAQTVIRFNLI